MHIIAIEKVKDFSEQGYHYLAYIDGNRKQWGSGHTKYAAIGEVLCAHQTELGIIIQEEVK